MIILNGAQTDNCGTLTVLLDKNKYDRARIAVEINGAIIRKSEYDKTMLRDGDKIEVVSFVGGG